jgi:hypothetical protein
VKAALDRRSRERLAAGPTPRALDLIGDIACPFDAFVSELSGRLPAQTLAGHRRRLLVERVELARDVEDNVHATEASPR